MNYAGWLSPKEFLYTENWIYSYRKEYYFRELVVLGFVFEELYFDKLFNQR